jgi:hypothetical protein
VVTKVMFVERKVIPRAGSGRGMFERWRANAKGNRSPRSFFPFNGWRLRSKPARVSRSIS